MAFSSALFRPLRFLLWCLLGLLPLAAPAQDYTAEKFEPALLQTRTGARLVYNGQQHSFTLELAGKQFAPTETPNMVRLDGRILQLTTLPFQTRLDFANLKGEKLQRALLDFQQYEAAYVKNELGVQATQEKTSFVTLNGRTFLLWSYRTPTLPATANVANHTVGQYYLLTVCFDHILVLNAPLEKPTDAAAVQAMLTKVGSTLKLYDQPQDLRKLYDALKPQP